MTPEDAFAALAAGVGAFHPRAARFSEEELSRWPSVAVSAMRAQKLLLKSPAATSAVCPGCEQQCVMPVNVVDDGERRLDPFVVCDKRSDINRVAVPQERLRQWQCDEKALCKLVADSLGLRRTSAPTLDPRLVSVGLARGRRRVQMLGLRAAEDPAIVVAGQAVPLSAVIVFAEGRFALDAAMIERLVDSAATADPRYTSSTARREARKLDTQAMYEDWQKAYRKLRRTHSDKSDMWCAQKIAASPAGRNRDADTIRKHMTK